MTETIRERCFGVLVVLLGTGMFYYNAGGTYVGPFMVMTKFLFAFGICGLGILAFLIVPDLKHGKHLAVDGLMLALPYLTTFFVSMLIWMYRNVSLSDVTRGLSDSLYQIIGLLVAAAYVVMFRDKAPQIQLVSMALANGAVLLVRYIRETGIVQFVRDFIVHVSSFGDVEIEHMIAVEIHDLTFAFGAVLVYFLLKPGKIRKRWLCILAALFFFLVGLKRIAFPGVLLGVALGWIGGRFPRKGGTVFLKVLGYTIIVCAVLYIWVVKIGLYDDFAELFGVDTMGRQDMNEFIDGYYTFSVGFGGYGLGYVSSLLLSGAARRVGTFLSLHNDYLRMYIELGFWGYLGWLWVSWGGKLAYFLNKRSFRMGQMVFALFVYCFFTYLTDNTYYYFYTNTVIFTLVLACGYETDGEQEEAEIL